MSIAEKAAIGAAVLLAGVALFQSALALGAPWGDMSYGGQAETVDGVLPGNYRVMSAVAVVILLFAAFLVLARAGVVTASWPGEGFLRPAVWVVFAYLGLNTVMNLMSSHAGERFGMGAVTLVAAVLTFIVARSDWAV
jgi:hypothetical protein